MFSKGRRKSLEKDIVSLSKLLVLFHSLSSLHNCHPAISDISDCKKCYVVFHSSSISCMIRGLKLPG